MMYYWTYDLLIGWRTSVVANARNPKDSGVGSVVSGPGFTSMIVIFENIL